MAHRFRHTLAMSARALPLALLLSTAALAASYDPGTDGDLLRSNALGAASAVGRACGLSLEPGKAADIKSGLDEGVRRAHEADQAAARLDGQSRRRTDEMAAAVKKSVLEDRTASLHRRWQEASDEHARLTARVEKLPEKKPDAKTGPDKHALQERLKKAADALREANALLGKSDDATAAAAAALGRMKDSFGRAQPPASQLQTAAAEVQRLAALLPGAVDEAKERVDLLGQEPRNVSRTRAWDKLEGARALTQGIFSAADSEANRAQELAGPSSSFGSAQSAFDKARQEAGVTPPQASALLDEAVKACAQVREALP